MPELAYQKPEPEPQPEFAEAIEAHAPSAATLSDEDVATLAQQLAEAKHEEAQAEADDLPEPQEAGAEPFVEEAELEELQDALNDEHEDDAAEADAVADEMHDEAMAAEASSEESHEDAGETDATEETQGDSSFAMEASDEETREGKSHSPPKARLILQSRSNSTPTPLRPARAFPSSHVRDSSGPCAVEDARSAAAADAAVDARTTSGLARSPRSTAIHAMSTIGARN